MEKIIIAVDAGGTKTKVSILDVHKKVIFTHLEGCGSPAVIGEKALDNIHQGLVVANDYVKGKYQVICIAIGISALDVIRDKKIYEEQYSQEFNSKVIIESDAVLALHSIFTDLYDEGVLVLSGTGSAILGIKNNKTRMYGGWGHLLTEAGSSYSVVRNFICQTIRQYESNDVISDLGQRFMNHLNFTRIEQFKILIYHHTKNEVAAYSRFFNELAENEHNEEAIVLLKKAGQELAIDVRNAFKGLNLSSNAVLGFGGGFIRNAIIAQNELISTLKTYGINSKVVTGDSDPIFGAYYMVKRMGLIC